jgi:hypothetical protein
MKFTPTDATTSNRKGVVGMVTAQVASGGMKCPDCKHPIGIHSAGGCYHEKKNGDLCSCLLCDGEVALLLLPILEKKIAELEQQLADMQEMLLEEQT